MRLSMIPICAALALAAPASPAAAEDVCLQLFINGQPVGPCMAVPAETTCVDQDVYVGSVKVGVLVCLPMGTPPPNTAR